MQKQRILQNTFISVSVLLALTMLRAAGTSDCVLTFGKAPVGVGIITFDALGAGTGLQQGTLALAINDVGTIAGYYFDSNPITHGFARATDGTISKFDALG